MIELSKPSAVPSKSMLLTWAVIHVDIILRSFMHYMTRHLLCRHNGSLFDIKWRIKFSCKINFTTISFISEERMSKGGDFETEKGNFQYVSTNEKIRKEICN
jgi:hypothetical protein